jgi:hypothetical protein
MLLLAITNEFYETLEVAFLKLFKLRVLLGLKPRTASLLNYT